MACAPKIPRFEVESVTARRRTNEEEQVQRGADHRDFAGAGSRNCDSEVCRRHGISDGTFYKLKANYGGMEVSGAKRLKGLKLLAEAMLDNAALKGPLGKNG